MKLELNDAYNGDEGEYLRVTVAAGKVEAEILIEDGMLGQQVTLTFDGVQRAFPLKEKAGT